MKENKWLDDMGFFLELVYKFIHRGKYDPSLSHRGRSHLNNLQIRSQGLTLPSLCWVVLRTLAGSTLDLCCIHIRVRMTEGNPHCRSPSLKCLKLGF
ncbi:hypothetical protein Hanom_Chr17g01559471 [Helianthus anomalus]